MNQKVRRTHRIEAIKEHVMKETVLQSDSSPLADSFDSEVCTGDPFLH